MKTQSFVLTDDHIKLLRRFNVRWNVDMEGAPEIDPKRPYGNSDALFDVCEILTGEGIGMVHSDRDDLTPNERARYAALHSGTATALQIVLSVGEFKPGLYEAGPYSIEWKWIAPVPGQNIGGETRA